MLSHESTLTKEMLKGFKVDIMEEGDLEKIPVEGGKHIY